MKSTPVKRALTIAATASIVLGLALIGVSWRLGGIGGSIAWANGGLRVYRNTDMPVITQRGLSGVTAINVEATSADVEFVPADSFGLEIKTSTPEPSWSLNDGVLNIREEGSGGSLRIFSMSLSSSCITVFYPARATLDELRVTTVSGDITIPGIVGEVRQSVELSTTSGSIQLESLQTPDLNVRTNSGDIRTQGVSAPSARVDTTSGKVEFREFTGSLDATSISGDIEVSGTYQGGNIGSTSGSVRLTSSLPTEDFNYHLETVSGTLQVNGKQQGNPADSATSGSRGVTVKTISGDITINFGK
jgi:lia operon protein LiaG